MSGEEVHPVPFEIVEAEGAQHASNGSMRIMVMDGGRIFRRRGQKGLTLKPPAEAALPLVNQLAGELLNDPSMSAAQVQQKLLAIAGLVPLPNVQRVEWAVAELDGVRAYCMGTDVILTKQDLSP